MSFTFKRIEKFAARIDEQLDCMRRTNVKGVLTIGRQLHKARAVLGRKGDGIYGEWCKKRLKISRTTAHNMLNAYLVFGDCPTVEHSFELTALYLLSKNGIPKDVIETAISIAEGGGRVTAERARNLIGDSHEQRALDDAQTEDDEDDEEPSQRSAPPKRTPLERLQKAWNDASEKERKEFRNWAKQWRKQTELEDDGRRLLV